jgi:hypothetical protein
MGAMEKEDCDHLNMDCMVMVVFGFYNLGADTSACNVNFIFIKK